MKNNPLHLALLTMLALIPVVRGQLAMDSDGLGAAYSYSSKGNLTQNGTKVGDVSVSRFDFSASMSQPLGEGLRFLGHAFWNYDSFSISGPVFLPKQLESAGVGLGVMKRLNADWSFTAMARPGFYGDFDKLDGKSFNVPAFVRFVYRASPEVDWAFGLGVNPRSKFKVLPIIGVRWQFAPDWTLAIGFPETGIIRKVNESLRLRAGLRYQGGGYRITTAPGPGLGNTFLEYHEFRLGADADIKVSDTFALELGGGVVVNRRFDYYQLNYRLQGKSAGYLKVGGRIKF